jgi:hypothetical protein
MAPPPPSASYLWKLEDSDTDAESDAEIEDPTASDRWNPSAEQPAFRNSLRIGEDLLRRNGIVPNNAFVPSTTEADGTNRIVESKEADVSEVPAVTLVSDTSNEEEDEEEIVSDEEIGKGKAPSHQRKRKKHKKKKHKKKSPSSQTTTTIKNHVSFGTVTLLEFARCLGTSVVPTHGGWPLGMEYHPADNIDPSVQPVEDYESQKHERLLQRRSQLIEKAGNKDIKIMLETRQWDYKSGKEKNPLFGMLHEADRMHLLLSSTSDPPPPENETSPSSQGRGAKSRSRSGSVGGGPGEQFNHIFTATLVHQIRNELEQIRNSRTMEGSMGCTCRKLNVTGGGKKSQRRMKLQKVKEELRKRQRLPPEHETMSREELELVLQTAVDQEPCCLYADSCFCARNEIGCQAETCSCWHSSHQLPSGSKGASSSKAPSPEEIRARCGNVVSGMYVVDIDAIDTFRNDYLNQLKACPFISIE